MKTLLTILLIALTLPGWAGEKIQFNKDIRKLLSNACFHCHGPDAEDRKAGFRLDTFEGAIADNDGVRGIVPGDPDASEILYRMTSDDPDEVMPPPGKGEALTPEQVALIKQWIKEGAEYETHWSYVVPEKPALPATKEAPVAWQDHPIDAFIHHRLKNEGLTPSPEADPITLARRIALDLTGLPPTPAEVDAFVADLDQRGDAALGDYIDGLMARPTFGEHWARMWLDLARYADSAGYADDPSRTIWAYRDYVIKAFNDNLPFDQFTIEQLAGDLLPEATEAQKIATAFHRNTQTNSEGGTNDEEFRNVAVVDRVNTTMATWMGTTMACAQCHTHKYDPITHHEYFNLFAIFNSTEDSDKKDERPTLGLYTETALAKRAKLESEIKTLDAELKNPDIDPAALAAWAASFQKPSQWTPLVPTELNTTSKATLATDKDGTILASGDEVPSKELYTLTGPIDRDKPITAIKLEVLADKNLPRNGPGRNGNFVLTELSAATYDEDTSTRRGRFVRLDLPGKGKFLHVAEVEVYANGENIARKGTAKQSSTGYNSPAKNAIDGVTNKGYNHTNKEDNPWWEVDLNADADIERIVVWNRPDGNIQSRLDGFKISLLDAKRNTIWEESHAKAPMKDLTAKLDGSTPATLLGKKASATFEQNGFTINLAADGKSAGNGWAVHPQTGKDQYAVFPLATPISGTTLKVNLHQEYNKHALGKFRILTTSAAEPLPALPAALRAAITKAPADRNDAERRTIKDAYVKFHPSFDERRETLASLRSQLADLKPDTTVPVMRELPEGKHRTTHVHLRGSYLNKGDQVERGIPAAFHDYKGETDMENMDRLDLAKWLMDADNPLTSRVIANRFWEKLFGIGLVATSEEFGSQGERPSHPELLDYLAVHLQESGWDTKAFLKTLVMSATYRQSSHVTQEMLDRDAANRLLARGPRIRLTAEMVRDQALFVSGLLSPKMYGPPVRPPQPNLGLRAAFGGGVDWKTSAGEDKFRRGLYTTWRRSSPYPSMATFDAPNREVCTVRRDRTNTPLQALVTLNDPVYIEAAQALARRMVQHTNIDEQLLHGFRLCVSRHPTANEKTLLKDLFQETHEHYKANQAEAKAMATNPIGPVPDGMDTSELAAMTIVANVLLNLDEILMKR